MKKSGIFFYVVLFALLFAGITACTPANDDPEDPPTPAVNGFTWRENSTTAPLKTAGSSEVRTQYKSIFAFTGATPTSGTLFEFNLTGVTPGTYPVNASNAFYFDGNPATPVSGEVMITSNAAGKATGTFKATWSGGGITAVYGTFTNIPVN